MKVPVGVKLLALVLGSTLFYTWVGQLVPQKEVRPPEVVELAEDMTTADLVGIGQQIFVGKGLCSTCHTIGQSGALRFPDLDGIATRAASREPGVDALSYLAQSIYRPNEFIVPGFNPGMPQIDKPPIGLSDDEILAVIAYLQTLGGEATMEVGMTLPYAGGVEPGERVSTATAGGAPDAGEADTPGAVDAVAGPASAAPAATASPLLARFGCDECHDNPDDPGRARSLAGVGSRLDRAAIQRWLTDHEPPLPASYTGQVTLAEVRDMTAYLAALKEQG